MKLLAVTFVALVCAAAGATSVDALIESARSLPAEFSADALIRIAAAPTLDKSRKLEILTQAFDRAAGAQLPYKRVSVLLRPETLSAYWNRVYRQEMDALSL